MEKTTKFLYYGREVIGEIGFNRDYFLFSDDLNFDGGNGNFVKRAGSSRKYGWCLGNGSNEILSRYNIKDIELIDYKPIYEMY